MLFRSALEVPLDARPHGVERHAFDLIMRNLTHVEGMSLDAMRAGIQWDFESYPEYLGAMERRGGVANVASLVGHSSGGPHVLGGEAASRAATEAAIAQMRRIVPPAVHAGARRL